MDYCAFNSVSELKRSKSVDDALLDEIPPESAANGSHFDNPCQRSRSADAVDLGKSEDVNKSDFMSWAGFFFDESTGKTDDAYARLPVPEDSMSDSGSSVGYFSKVDFSGSNWQVPSEYIPPIGFAVVAGSLVFCHPFIFVAGAITALGTASAAGAAYDCCADGAFCTYFNKEPAKNGEEMKKEVSLEEVVSEVTFSLEQEENNVNDDDDELDVLTADEGDDVPRPLPLHRMNPSRIHTRTQALEWVALYFPTLSSTALETVDLGGLNALEFFDVFLANDAPFTFQELQRKRQDKDIQYGRWETLKNVQQPSLHAKALSCADMDFPVRERALHFKAKTNSYFGPPYATTTKVQRALKASKRLLVLESKTTVSDVPFCERFYVMERWVVTAQKSEKDDRYNSCLSIYSQVFFTKKCPFNTQIITQSEATILEIAEQWKIMAQDALRRTERAREKRLQSEKGKPEKEDTASTVATGSTKSDDEDDSQSVEVRHLGASKSWVVGDGEEPEPKPKVVKRQLSLQVRRVSRGISNLMKRGKSNVSDQ